jgi:hypothetical protein
MSGTRLTALLALSSSLAVLFAAGATARSESATALPPSSRLQTAIFDQVAFGGAAAARAFRRAHDTGATATRLVLLWNHVAPASPAADFDPADPADPGYNWTAFDQQVRLAVAQGLEPIVNIFGAPTWATEREVRGGDYKPDPDKLAAFATAAATRYAGSFQDLPRARYWQLWNEPNLALFLRPQLIGKTVYSADWYRRMLNAFAAAVHGVHADNSVIAGSTSPFTSRAGKRTSWGPGPLLFLREVLCLSKELRPTCSERAQFDIWAHHPYTSGGPRHRASAADDVSLGDLPRMRAALDAGARTGRIATTQKLRFWVTEFSWDTNPPDPNAMPIALQTRWVSEALYRMAQSGVSLVTWYLIRDEPLSSPYQSGLYFRRGRPKPSLQAFRFPFVAFRKGAAVNVWGRTPSEEPGTVVVEHRTDGGWRRLGTLTSNSLGVFRGRFSAPSGEWMRARLTSGAEASRPFSLTEPADRYYRPFGEPG